MKVGRSDRGVQQVNGWLGLPCAVKQNRPVDMGLLRVKESGYFFGVLTGGSHVGQQQMQGKSP